MDISELIHLAWCDKTTFNDIEKQTGLNESAVMRLMKKNLKPGSYRVWRERVRKYKRLKHVHGRTEEHNKKQ